MTTQRVAATSAMDTETFCKHFNARHKADLGGLTQLDPKRLMFEIEQQYRAYHLRLHRVKAQQHQHRDEPPYARIEYALRCLEENHMTGWREIAGASGVVAFFPTGDRPFAVRKPSGTKYYDDAESAAKAMVRR